MRKAINRLNFMPVLVIPPWVPKFTLCPHRVLSGISRSTPFSASSMAFPCPLSLAFNGSVEAGESTPRTYPESGTAEVEEEEAGATSI